MRYQLQRALPRHLLRAMASVLCALVVIPLAGSRASVSADDQTGWQPIDATADTLAWAHYQNTYSGYTRVERSLELALIHQIYQDNPAIPNKDVDKEVLRLRDTLEATSKSPQAEFLDTAQTWMTMLDVAATAASANPEGEAGAAIVNAATKLLNFTSEFNKAEITNENAYLTTVDRSAHTEQVAQYEEVTFQAVRSSPNQFEIAAANSLYLPELNLAVNASENSIIKVDQAIRSTLTIMGAIDIQTGQLSQEIHNGVASIRLDLSKLNAAWNEKWSETQSELKGINSSLADINSKLDAQGKSFAAYVADQKARQAYADQKAKDAQQYQQALMGIQASISIISKLVGLIDPKAGHAIQAVGMAALSIGTSLVTWIKQVGSLATLATPLGLLNSATLVNNVIGAVQSIFGAFSGTSAPTELDLVSAKLDQLKEQVANLQQEMDTRFDRLNEILKQVFDGMNTQFQMLNRELVAVSANVQLALSKLSNLQISLSGLDNAIRQFATAEAVSRVQDMIGSVINYSDNHPGSELPQDLYNGASDLFSTFGLVDALSDPRLVGESGRSTDPRDVAKELSLPLEGNLQYISSLIQLRTGEPGLGSQPMNPRAWAWAAQALALLYQQWPDYARQDDDGHGSTKHLDDFIAAGQRLQAATTVMTRDRLLMKDLLDQYAADTSALIGVDSGLATASSSMGTLQGLESAELHNLVPNLMTKGATAESLLWGPISQPLEPPDVPFAPNIPIGCGPGSGWATSAPYSLRWPGATAMAVKFGLADVNACLTNKWVNSVTDSEGDVTANLQFTVSVTEALKSNSQSPAAWHEVMRSTYVDRQSELECMPPDRETGRPRLCISAQLLGQKRFAGAAAYLATEEVVIPSGSTEINSVVSNDQSRLRQQFYEQVGAALTGVGGSEVEGLREQIAVVAGDKALLSAALQIALPRALESDDYLASLIAGPDLIPDPAEPSGISLDGSIIGGDSTSISNWLDGSRTSAAPDVALATLDSNNSSHVEALRQTIDYYQTKVIQGVYEESLPVVGETLTRLDAAKRVVFGQMRLKTPQATSEDGIQAVERHEHYHQLPYMDTAGRCSVGYGHVIHDGRCNGTEPAEFIHGITQTRADQLALEDIRTTEKTISTTVTVCLNQHEFDALVDLVFNIRSDRFTSSRVLQLLNSGDPNATVDAIRGWRYVDGNDVSDLTARREDEIREFQLGGVLSC